MARKKVDMTNIFARTAKAPAVVESEKKRRPTGVYLRKDTRAEVERIAAAEGVAIHALLAYAIAYFIRQYKAGHVKLEQEKQTRLKLDI